jgi:hypothetical protein
VLRNFDVFNVLRKSDVFNVLRKSDVFNVLRKSDVFNVLRKSDVFHVLRKSDVFNVLRKSEVFIRRVGTKCPLASFCCDSAPEEYIMPPTHRVYFQLNHDYSSMLFLAQI